MRVNKALVPILARQIVESLVAKEMVDLKTSKEDFLQQTEQLIFQELSVEDRINREVRELLKSYDSEIEKGRLDYRRLFELTKQKLVKERKVIL